MAAQSLSGLFTLITAPNSPPSTFMPPQAPALTFGPREPGSPSEPGFPGEPFGNIREGGVTQKAEMRQAPLNPSAASVLTDMCDLLQTGLLGLVSPMRPH